MVNIHKKQFHISYRSGLQSYEDIAFELSHATRYSQVQYLFFSLGEQPVKNLLMPAVYCLFHGQTILYIGSSNHLFQRLAKHRSDYKALISSYKFCYVGSIELAMAIEAHLQKLIHAIFDRIDDSIKQPLIDLLRESAQDDVLPIINFMKHGNTDCGGIINLYENDFYVRQDQFINHISQFYRSIRAQQPLSLHTQSHFINQQWHITAGQYSCEPINLIGQAPNSDARANLPSIQMLYAVCLRNKLLSLDSQYPAIEPFRAYIGFEYHRLEECFLINRLTMRNPFDDGIGFFPLWRLGEDDPSFHDYR